MLVELSQFELLDFLEGCSIGSHLRQGVWQRCIDQFYDKLDDEERNFIFHFSVRDIYDRMVKPTPKCGAEDFLAFIACFNPANRYKITMSDGSVVSGYFHNGKYHVALNRFCAPEHIVKIEQDTKRLETYNRDYYYRRDELHGHIKEFA